ncbi:hypothetical protein RIF29_20206 [Crotalaria pallida]|uniref:Uncharacterized protein n=1 Tax=Crotalaria pallida TaxID=3830 RepID=A0AAN9F311_CROPI
MSLPSSLPLVALSLFMKLSLSSRVCFLSPPILKNGVEIGLENGKQGDGLDGCKVLGRCSKFLDRSLSVVAYTVYADHCLWLHTPCVDLCLGLHAMVFAKELMDQSGAADDWKEGNVMVMLSIL